MSTRVRLADFEGDWRVSRFIDDRRAGRAGRFEGTARFAPAPGGLAYREEGVLRLDGAGPVAASRGYFWRVDGDGIAVLFEDGRAFHRFHPEGAGLEAVHECPPDRYAVRYDFSAWPAWRAAWRVTGPRKDYALFSEYRRE